MIIDSPRPEDIPALRRIWLEAFGDSNAFLDLFFATGYAPERCRCVRMDSRTAAALYWFDCCWEGKKIAYIYAVATDKAFRGRGLCSALMANTHDHLQNSGYAGAALVPGSKGLFTLYEKLGYRSFCPMTTVTVCTGGTALPLRAVDKDTFGSLRRQLLPAGSVLQEGAALSYLAGFAAFFAAEGCLMCLSREEDTALFQEYLGDPALLPGILTALGVQKGTVRISGGEDSAMYYDLSGTRTIPSYLGIPLG